MIQAAKSSSIPFDKSGSGLDVELDNLVSLASLYKKYVRM
jgi:hypothetical protein